jgi:hypothetical protein
MRQRGKEGYIGTDVWTGAVRMIVPNLFVAEGYNDLNGKFQIGVSVNQKEVNEKSKMIIQNNIAYRRSVEFGSIDELFVSDKVVKKIQRYLDRGQEKKAGEKVWGYCMGRLKEYMDEDFDILEDIGEISLSNFDKRESRLMTGYYCPSGDGHVVNFPNHFLATVYPNGKIDLDDRPRTLKGKAREKLSEMLEDPETRSFKIYGKTLDRLTGAYFNGNKNLSDQIVKIITNSLNLSPEENGN